MRRAERKKTRAVAKRTDLAKRRKDAASRVRDLETRLAEALEQGAEARRRERDALNREAEALDRQTATSEILTVISRSPTDVQPVFEAVVESAVRLCEARFGAVFRLDHGLVHLAAQHNFNEAQVRLLRAKYPMAPNPGHVSGRTILSSAVAQIPDIFADEEYRSAEAKAAGFRSLLGVPLLHGGNAVGAIVIYRPEPGPFTDTHVELLKTFAEQAVIAIENVRLFTELEARNRELREALEQQMATAEILRVTSHSPTDAQPVFDAIVDSARRLLRGYSATAYRRVGDQIHLAAYTSTSEAGDADLRSRFPMTFADAVGRHTPFARIWTEARIRHVVDFETEPTEPDRARQLARTRGYRSMLQVPMHRSGRVIGVLTVSRSAPGRFTDNEIRLLETFADQAVIAVENVRLFEALEARTAALTRSVDQLTALGEVGRAVASTLDLETVLTTIVARAVQLSGLDGGVVFEYDGDAEQFVHRAATDTGGALADVRRATRIRKGEGVVGRTAVTLEPVQVPDITVPDAYESRLRENLVESGIRAILAVPMVREGRLIGCLGVTRKRPGEFPAETIELLRTFATQSALAIQNARLYHELADKSRQLEAASRHKSEFLANMSHELRTPLNAIIGFSEVLTERMFGELNDKQEEYLRDIHASGQHLLSLINDILDLSKIEAGRMELEVKDFDLPLAIGNAVTLVRERAVRRGIALHQAMDQRLGGVRGDERKIKQVLLNLLSNALKFTPEGGRVDVHATVVDGAAAIAVTDTGVGIAPEDQEAVFEEFRQVGTADRKVEGTGLGLALSRKFVELHGGRIWVESRMGHGSTFTFTLPLR